MSWPPSSLAKGVKKPAHQHIHSVLVDLNITGEIEVGTPGQKIKAVEGDSPLVVAWYFLSWYQLNGSAVELEVFFEEGISN